MSSPAIQKFASKPSNLSHSPLHIKDFSYIQPCLPRTWHPNESRLRETCKPHTDQFLTKPRPPTEPVKNRISKTHSHTQNAHPPPHKLPRPPNPRRRRQAQKCHTPLAGPVPHTPRQRRQNHQPPRLSHPTAKMHLLKRAMLPLQHRYHALHESGVFVWR